VAATNIGVSLYYSDAWQHARSLDRQTVQASWGLPDEGEGITPAKCGAQLDNADRDDLVRPYSPDDARSTLYGRIGRNTPGRVALAAGLNSGTMSDTADAFGRTSVDTWGSTDTGEAWSLTGLGGTVSNADFDVAGGFGTQSVPVADAYRYAYLNGVSVRDVNIAVTFKVAQATGASLYPANILIRGDSDLAYIRGRVEVTTTNTVKVLIVARGNVVQLGEATVAGLTHTGTGQPLRVRLFAAGNRIQMRVWIAANTEPDTWDLTVTDTTEAPQTGWIGLRSGRAVGNSNTSPVVFSYDNWESTTYLPIADGAVSSWAPDRNPTEGDAWTDIEITGPSQRINSSKSVISAIRGSLKAELASNGQSEPEGYWPLEDGENTLTTESLVDRTPGFSVYQAVSTVAPGIVKFGEGTSPPGSAPIIDLSGGGSLRVILPDNDSFSDIWTLDWVATFPLNGQDGSVPGSMLTLITDSPGLGYITTDAGPTWRMFYAPSEGAANTGRAIASAPPGFPAAPLPTPYDDGQPHHYRLAAEQNGGDVEITLYYDDFQVGVAADFSDDGNPTTTIGRIKEIRINDANPEGGSMMPSIGQIVLWYSTPSDTHEMVFGYDGERATTRFLRLLDEHNIVGAVAGDTDSPMMGPQYPATLPELLDFIRATDGGMIYDGRAWNGLEMRPGRTLFNQTAALELTFGEDGNVAEAKPVTDDLGIANDFTATGLGLGEAHAERSSGPLNVNDPIDDPEGISRKPGQVDGNPVDRDAMMGLATWGLHKGTWPGARYPQVVVDLTKHPELIPAVMALRPGDLITIEGLDVDLVELIVLGGAHDIEYYHHVVTLNCAPAGPYRVGLVSGTGMRVSSGTSSLATDFNAGVATSMSVAVTGALWKTSGTVPFHIRVGGVVLNVTAISGASSPQTFTVDATPVNGVSRLIEADGPAALTRVNLADPAYVGL